MNIFEKLLLFVSNKSTINNTNVLNNYSKNALVFIQDEKQLYQPLTNSYVGLPFSQVLKYVYYANQTAYPKFLDILWSDTLITSTIRPVSDGVVPIGICVAEHNYFYQNSKPRFMSIVYMSPNNPNNGSYLANNNNTIFWGNWNKDVAYGDHLKDYSYPCYISNPDNTAQAYLKSLYWGMQYIDSDNINSRNFNKTNESINSKYFSDILNVNDTLNFDKIYGYGLGDFKGKENTEVLTNRSVANNWKNTTVINNVNTVDQFPAAQCCWRFNPGFTNQGDWYLPSIGELSVLITYDEMILYRLSELKVAGYNVLQKNDNTHIFQSLLSSTPQSKNTQASSEYNQYYYILRGYDSVVTKNSIENVSQYFALAFYQYSSNYNINTNITIFNE